MTATASAYSVTGALNEPDGAVVGHDTLGIFLYDNQTSRDVILVITLYPATWGAAAPTGTIPIVPYGDPPTENLTATLLGGGRDDNGASLSAISGSVTITASSADSSSGPGHIQGTFTGTMRDIHQGRIVNVPISGSFDAVNET